MFLKYIFLKKLVYLYVFLKKKNYGARIQLFQHVRKVLLDNCVLHGYPINTRCVISHIRSLNLAERQILKPSLVPCSATTSTAIGQTNQSRSPNNGARYRTLLRATLQLTTLNSTQLLAISLPEALNRDN